VSDDDDEREHGRRRHASGGGAGRWAMIAGWILAAGLAANLIVGKLRPGEAGRPQGFLSESLVLVAAFWTPIAVLAGAAVMGAVWTLQTHARREKPSLLWMRNSFIFGAIATLLIVVAVQTKSVKREWLAVWFAVLAAAQMSLFAYAAFREYRRTVGHGGGRRGGGSGQGD